MIDRGNVYTLVLALLGIVKLLSGSLGYNLFVDTNMEDVANALATIIAAVGVILTHRKKVQTPQE